MKLLHPGPAPVTLGVGFTVEPATGDGAPVLVISFLLFHVRVPLLRLRKAGRT